MAITLEAEKRPGENEEEFLRTVNSRIAGGSKSVRTDPPRVSRMSLLSALLTAMFTNLTDYRGCARIPIFFTVSTSCFKLPCGPSHSHNW